MAETRTYGSRDKSLFSVGRTNYYLLVDSKTGETTIKSPTVAGNALGSSYDRTVGTISNIGKFKPESGFITTDELQHFSTPSNIIGVRNQAIITARKGGAENPERLLFPNRPQTPPPAPPQGGTGNAAEESNEKKDTVESTQKAYGEIESADFRKTYGNLKYPNDMRPELMDIVKFTMINYIPQSFKKETFGLTGLERFNDKTKKTYGTVSLGIQPSIQDDNRITWTSEDLGILGAAGLESSLTIMESGVEGVQQSIQKILSTGTAEQKNTVSAILQRTAQEATGTKGVLARLGGAIVNPNIELLFNAPELRTFSFTFKMSPRDEPESTQVKKIIRFFKEGSSVKRSKIALFLKAPNVFEIKYIQKRSENKSLNRIKICALTSVSVDYTPMGSYMTFEKDGGMVSYNLSLQFQELEPIYADDYTSLNDVGPNESVGY